MWDAFLEWLFGVVSLEDTQFWADCFLALGLSGCLTMLIYYGNVVIKREARKMLEEMERHQGKEND